MIFFGIEPMLTDYRRLCDQRGLSSRYVRATQGAPWRSWWALFRALGQLRPDAIVLHSVKTIVPCWLYASVHRIPLIAVEHQSNELKTVAERRVSRLVMRLADAVVVLTPAYRSALRLIVGRVWRGDKVYVIANGIDTDCFSPAARLGETANGPRRIGMASRFSAIKRHDLLLAAFANLRDSDGDQAWQLSLAGDGETHAEMQRLAHVLAIEDIVDFPGCLDEQQLFEWFQRLDIYVQASDGETLSTSMLQAMALGLPIVGSPVPGIENLLSEADGTGLLARDQSAEAFADAFRQLVEDPDGAAAVSARARALAVSQYSQDTMFKRYRELVQACLKPYT
jgi:glycosyltransferase involved in cell wall biosynthesis